MSQPGKAEQINTENGSGSFAGAVFQSGVLWEETEELRPEHEKAVMGPQHPELDPFPWDPIPGVTAA